jgi:hypothetical protein
MPGEASFKMRVVVASPPGATVISPMVIWAAETVAERPTTVSSTMASTRNGGFWIIRLLPSICPGTSMIGLNGKYDVILLLFFLP